MLKLETTKRTDERLLKLMQIHYSKPKGFVGRNICYAVLYNDIYYGHIVGGSATLHLPNRNEYFNNAPINQIINNIFYHIEKVNNKYPIRNFTSLVVREWRERVSNDWYNKYGDNVVGYESLVELPRNGILYIKDGWELIGITKGYTCKRTAGHGTDTWTGKRVWNTQKLRPKLVFVKRIS